MKFLQGSMAFVSATMFLNFAGLTTIIPVIPYMVERYTTPVGFYVGFVIAAGSLCSFCRRQLLLMRRPLPQTFADVGDEFFDVEPFQHRALVRAQGAHLRHIIGDLLVH